MVLDNLFDDIEVVSLSIPANQSGTDTTVSSSAVDTQGIRGCQFLVYYGNSADTLGANVKLEAKLQSSATEGGTYADVADADVHGSTTNAFALADAPTEDSELYALCYNGTTRWVKILLTLTGAHTNGTPLCMFAIKKKPFTGGDTAVNP